MCSGFSKIQGKCGKICTCLKKRSAKHLSNDAYVMFLCCFIYFYFLYKGLGCGYSFERYRQVDAIQMGTHNICLHKLGKKYTGCNLKTLELLDCVLIGVCAVIRLNRVICYHFMYLNCYLVCFKSRFCSVIVAFSEYLHT